MASLACKTVGLGHTCFVWTIDNQTAKLWTTPCPISPGRHRIGVTASPAPGQWGIALLDLDCVPGHSYRITANFNVVTVHRTGVEFQIVDESTGQIVARAIGATSPFRTDYPDTRKPIEVQDLETLVGFPIDMNATPMAKRPQ